MYNFGQYCFSIGKQRTCRSKAYIAKRFRVTIAKFYRIVFALYRQITVAGMVDDKTISQRVRKYSASSTGPFLVIAEGAKISPSTVSKNIIRKFGDKYVKATPLSKHRMKILMASASAANDLVETSSSNLKFSIPQRLVETLGVGHVELDVDDDELKLATSFDKTKAMQINNPAVLEIRRIKKGSGEDAVRLSTVIVTFSGQKLPTHIEINKVLYPIKQYVYPLRQCKQCWRFGHGEKNCRSKVRCKTCLETNISEEHDCNPVEPTCVNCNGTHAADNTNACPKAAQRQEADRKRNDAYSQGPKDWFSTLAVPVAPVSTPAIIAPSTSTSTQTTSNGNQKSADANDNGHLSPAPNKRRCPSISSDGSELPALELHVESRIRDIVEEVVTSQEISGAFEDILGTSENRNQEAEGRLRATISDILSQRVQTFFGSLRL